MHSTSTGNGHIKSSEVIIGDKFKLDAKKKIGSGAFGEIYEGENTMTKEKVAIKLEPIDSKSPQLQIEYKLYNSLQGGIGLPNVYCYRTQGNFNILVMDMLGKSLEGLHEQCGRRFSLPTICLIGDQMIQRIEYVHSKNYIHRDIKPDNFLIGEGNKKRLLYIIDFGLSKRFRDPKTGMHIPYRDGKNLTGTARYASINTHLGIEQSRRDDLEAIGYVLLYLLKGMLPWQGLPAKKPKEKYKKIMEKKISTPVEELCKDCPHEFQKFIHYTRNLRFDDRPDYKYLRMLIGTIKQREGITEDDPYDWEESKPPVFNPELLNIDPKDLVNLDFKKID